MNTWKEKIVAFGQLAQKNASIAIEGVARQDLETIFDAIAQDAQWSNKKVREKDTTKIISYETEISSFSGVNFQRRGYQRIEYYISGIDNNIQLIISSRFLLNPLDIAAGFITIFDFFNRNQKNLNVIIYSLTMAFGEKVQISKNSYNSFLIQPYASDQVNLLGSIVLSIYKIFYLFFLVLIICMGFYGLGWLIWVYLR